MALRSCKSSGRIRRFCDQEEKSGCSEKTFQPFTANLPVVRILKLSFDVCTKYKPGGQKMILQLFVNLKRQKAQPGGDDDKASVPKES